MSKKPTLSYKQIWNLNFGYLGLQVCLSLVIANTSRILSALGAGTDNLASLWLVAPLAGLFLQPIIGYYSDKTWTKWGRRIPYIFVGIITTAVMMIFMLNSQEVSDLMPPILAGVSIIFLMQSALNVTMQPYRALVGDMVNEKQSNLGYSIQTLLSNIGGIIGAVLPFSLAYWGISNLGKSTDSIAPSVVWSFYIGVVLLLITGFRTCTTVKEYPPKLFEEYNAPINNKLTNEQDKERGVKTTILRLSVVQFFSWFAFYYIWVYATEGIANTIWNTSDPLSEDYNNAGNWFGIMTGIYSLVAALFSIVLPRISDQIGRKTLYALSLMLGGVSLVSIFFITNQYLLLLPMIGLGIAWAMILTAPFVILAGSVPPHKMGFYMGVLNMTIVIPQIAAGLAGGYIFNHIAGGTAISMMLVAGISLLLAAISIVLIQNKKEIERNTGCNL